MGGWWENRLGAVLAGMLVVTACGSGPSGPSPVSAAPPPSSASPTPSATPATWPAPPAGLDPAYVRAVGHVSAEGIPRRWVGGPFRHCLAGGIDPAEVARAAELMTRVSGIPATTLGECNVEWILRPEPGTFAELSGSATEIRRARVFFHSPEGVRGSGVMHEGGHVLGLDHSPRPKDLMYPHLISQTGFSDDELAVLAWVYRTK